MTGYGMSPAIRRRRAKLAKTLRAELVARCIALTRQAQARVLARVYSSQTGYLGLPSFTECPDCHVSRVCLIECMEEETGPNRAMAESLIASCESCREWYAALGGQQ